MAFTDVYVRNSVHVEGLQENTYVLKSIQTRVENNKYVLEEIRSKMEHLYGEVGEIKNILEDIQVYIQFFLVLVGIFCAFMIARWFWRSCVSRYIRQFWKFKI